MNSKKTIIHFKSMLENNDLVLKHLNKIFKHNQTIVDHHQEF